MYPLDNTLGLVRVSLLNHILLCLYSRDWLPPYLHEQTHVRDCLLDLRIGAERIESADQIRINIPRTGLKERLHCLELLHLVSLP